MGCLVILRSASQAESPSFSLPHAVCTARRTGNLSIQARSTLRARMFAPSAGCRFLDGLPTDRANILVVPLRLSGNCGLESRVSDASRRFLLAVSLLLVFVGDQH